MTPIEWIADRPVIGVCVAVVIVVGLVLLSRETRGG